MATIKVRMLRTAATPGTVLRKGREYELETVDALGFLEAGFAEPVEEAPKTHKRSSPKSGTKKEG